MAKTHELVFKINGSLGSKLSSSFATATGNVDKLTERLKSLEKVNLHVDKYKKLNEQLASTSKSMESVKAKAQVAKSEFEKSKKVTSSLANEYGKAQKKVDDLAMAVAKSTSPTKELRSELAVAKLEAKKAGDAFKASAKNTAELERKYKNTANNADSLTSKVADQSRKLKDLEQNLKKAGIASASLGKDQAKLQKQIDSTNKFLGDKAKFQKSLSDTKQAGRDFLKKGALFTGAVAVPLKFAVESESVMADINKVADFDSIAEKTEFEKAMRKKLATEIPMAFSDYGELISGAAAGGIKKAELLDFSTDAAKMAVAFDMDPGETGSMMAKWRTAFDMNQVDVVGLADQINYLSDNTAATAPQISDIVSRIGGLGEVAGISPGKIAALGATLVASGQGAEVSATAVKKLAVTLAKGESATKKQRAAFSALGLDSSQVAKDMQADAEGTINKVLASFEGLSDDKRLATLTQIFGEESAGAIAQLVGNLDVLKSNFANVNEEAGKFKGSMETEFQTRSATTENQLIKLRQTLFNITDSVGKALLPTLNKLAVKTAENMQKVQEWVDKNPKLAETIIKIVVGLGALIVALSGLKFGFNVLKTAYDGFRLIQSGFQLVTIGAELFGGEFSKVIGLFTANPIIAVIAAIVGGFILLYTNNEKFRNAVNSAVKNIVTWFGNLASKAMEVASNIYTWFSTKIQAVYEFMDGKVADIKGFFDAIGQAGEKAANWIQEKFQGAIGWISDKISSISNAFSGFGRGVSNFFSGGSSGNGGTRGEIPGYASGGIVNSATLAMVGEGLASEAIIPLENKNRSMRLWQYAGQKIGAFDRLGKVNTGGQQGTHDLTPITVNFSIDARGASEGVEQRLMAMMQELSPRLREMVLQVLREHERDRARLAFN